MAKKITVLLISLIMAFSAVSCGASNEKQESNEGAINVWTSSSTEKILQQQDYNHRYDNVKLEISSFKNEREAAQIIISANKEKKRNIEDYFLTVNELKNENGNTLPASAWEIYNQKYTFVPKICENTLSGLDIGWYPDALLPMDTAIAYGENSISWSMVETANEAKGYKLVEDTNINQGIWLELKVPKDAATGIYKGEFSLNIDGQKYDIPVEVEVYGYALGDYTHLKSSFGLSASQIGLAELDTTKEMYKAYENMLLNHRINPQGLPTGGDTMTVDITASEGLLETFMQEALEAATDGRWLSFNIPYATTTKTLYYIVDIVKEGEAGLEKLSQIYTVDSESGEVDFTVVRNADGTFAEITQEQKNRAVALTETIVDFDKYQQILLMLAERGLEESLKNIADENITEPVDIMGLASTYFIMYDEYNNQGRTILIQASYCQEKAYWVNQETADIIEETLTLSSEEKTAFENKYGISFDSYKSKVVQECREVRNKIVGNYEEEMLASHGVYIPQIRWLNDPDQRGIYEDYEEQAYGSDVESELWTYICNHPNTPYTTLQTDDFLISSRMYGWLMYEANIAGHLEWSTVYNYKGILNNGWIVIPTILMDNYYDALRWPTANGEGSLMYPGREYGIYGPVPSMRLKSLSEGVEDYDLLYELEEKYKERKVSGESFDNVYKLFYGKLRNGMKINYNDNLLTDFQSARDILAQLLVNAYEHGVVLEDYKTSKEKGIVSVSAPAEVNISCNGNKAISSSNEMDINGKAFIRYQFEISLNDEINMLEMTVEKDGKTLSQFNISVGGKSVSLNGADMKDYIFTSTSDELDDTLVTLDNTAIINREAEGETLNEKVTTITYKGVGEDSVLNYQRILMKVQDYRFNEDTESIQLYIYYGGEAPVDLEVLYNTENKRVLDIINSYKLQKGWNKISIYGGSLKFASEKDVIKYLAFNVKTMAECTISLGTITVGG